MHIETFIEKSLLRSHRGFVQILEAERRCPRAARCLPWTDFWSIVQESTTHVFNCVEIVKLARQYGEKV
jgi:hypothetical protein